MRGLCELEARDLPARLSDILADDEFRLFQGEITAGDVRCKWHMSVWRNGFWSVTGDFHDDGVIAGDFFTITFMLDPGHSVGAALKGSILDLTDNRNLTVSASGSDPWIRQNWSRFEASGPSVRLSAKIAPARSSRWRESWSSLSAAPRSARRAVRLTASPFAPAPASSSATARGSSQADQRVSMCSEEIGISWRR